MLSRRVKRNRQTAPVCVGDNVIVADDQAPRGMWSKGVVKEMHPGKDGIVRVADIRTTSSQIYRRPVMTLCVLDNKSK